MNFKKTMPEWQADIIKNKIDNESTNPSFKKMMESVLNTHEKRKESNTLKKMIMVMEEMGAKYLKSDNFHLFFNIKINSEIDNEINLKRAKDTFFKMFGLGLKVRRIN